MLFYHLKTNFQICSPVVAYSSNENLFVLSFDNAFMPRTDIDNNCYNAIIFFTYKTISIDSIVIIMEEKYISLHKKKKSMPLTNANWTFNDFYKWCIEVRHCEVEGSVYFVSGIWHSVVTQDILWNTCHFQLKLK